ncbi:MAG: UDP-N-acetylmuramoyl-L-alanyl-D-glutamate--2,6-diaminopimelate ligase [Planctomycetota bacterium]|jgi:UDP-N-acetylmuramoyl-L-alanyl-D-glutamate--2,6-diaminopimelate ligase
MTFDELLNLASSDKALGLCTDSRRVKAGDIFVAIKGAVSDGHDFVDQALATGAKYIVCQARQGGQNWCTDGQKVVVVENSAEAAALLAQASRGKPASHLTNLAVTGTNGKTTVAYLVRSCIQHAGQKCGLIGTIIYDTGSSISESVLTTPDSIAIAQSQSEMVAAGAKYMVIEASSHALSQDRLAGIEFKAAAFTNLSGDHLDYHVTQANYLAAKTRLFESLPPSATAVLNRESPQAAQIAAKTRAEILWYAVDGPADLTAHIESMDIAGSVFTLEWAGQRQNVKTVLLGRHNISNHLAAAGLSLAAGIDLEPIAAGLSAPDTVPGRLEKLDWGGDFCVLVDYAHTDDALKNVLSALKPLCVGSLRVVFGCGGDRDRTKRPRMARVAEELADSVIVTSDNPRTEQPEDIINEIVTGFENPDPQRITIEPDRKKAIELAIRTAGTGDIIVIAGKGHETYQIIGTKRFDFDDKKVALEHLRNLK